MLMFDLKFEKYVILFIIVEYVNVKFFLTSIIF